MIEIQKGFFIKKSSRKGKKYDIYVKRDGKYTYQLSFGSGAHRHYKDKTPLQAYKHLDHVDEDRRRRYYLRHGRTNDKHSAKYWANKYLW